MTLTGPGTVTIQASQGGDGTYLPATPVNQSFSSTAPIDLAPHDLTSDTSHPPFIVSASSAYGFLPEWHAFDGTATYWIGVGGGMDWLQIDLGSAKVLGAYAILATTELARMPKNWTMQGSNDGATWAVLDTQAGQTWANSETLTFRVPVVSAAYRYYRLNITANNGDGTYTDIGELYLYQRTIVGGLTAQIITFPAISDGAANDPPFVLIGTSRFRSSAFLQRDFGSGHHFRQHGHNYGRRTGHDTSRPRRERKVFRRYPGDSVLHGCPWAAREYRLRPNQGVGSNR